MFKKIQMNKMIHQILPTGFIQASWEVSSRCNKTIICEFSENQKDEWKLFHPDKTFGQQKLNLAQLKPKQNMFINGKGEALFISAFGLS